MTIKILEIYAIPFTIIVAAAFWYFEIACYFNIVDKPNQRSSHTVPTIRGGGIIFLLSTILFFVWNGFAWPYLLAAVIASGTISFIDDIRTVNNKLKFSVHILSVLLIFKECGILSELSPFYLAAIAIFVIGVINAYNFMDGINGITGLYSLAVISPLFLTETDEKLHSLQLFTIMGLLVFNYFNTRKKARCFAGDVGSISIAILVVFFLILRIKETNNFAYIGLLLVYGIDTVFTIMQRLYQKENIFKPHRKHLYQYYSNEKKVPHVIVSIFYAVLQFLISVSIVFGLVNFLGLLVLLISLSIVYWFLKVPFIRVAVT
ncbi:MAG: UDP-GlcNAc--UDP-phosphate GlcNAc-1-phosphate transferase [Ferruginibacter sp.]|nr:UDP-GlcNAc--UDP-phosphate GlcNAc-1-phosphate transferase [Ferruginibacter sp.]